MSPAERLGFVLHDMFKLPFEQIASMMDRSTGSTRQLASRARRRVRVADVPIPDSDVEEQRRVVDAFFRAARGGDFGALVEVLHPDVVLRSDFGPKRSPRYEEVEGAQAVSDQAVRFAIPKAKLTPILMNGSAGVLVSLRERPLALMGFIVKERRIVGIDAIADPERVASVAVGVIADSDRGE